MLAAYIFFFKHKTAYDMRISYWSSDVGSSDLRRSPRAAESRHVDDLLLSPLFLSRVQFAFVISFHILFPAFTIGLAHWLAFLEWRWLRPRESLWRDLYFFWLKIFALSFGMGVRSEEHTSELQSLMRISYAVFCLKKKNTSRI